MTDWAFDVAGLEPKEASLEGVTTTVASVRGDGVLVVGVVADLWMLDQDVHFLYAYGCVAVAPTLAAITFEWQYAIPGSNTFNAIQATTNRCTIPATEFATNNPRRNVPDLILGGEVGGRLRVNIVTIGLGVAGTTLRAQLKMGAV